MVIIVQKPKVSCDLKYLPEITAGGEAASGDLLQGLHSSVLFSLWMMLFLEFIHYPPD